MPFAECRECGRNVTADEATEPIREPIPGLIIAGWLCGDCRSMSPRARGHCRLFRLYVGEWSRACSRSRIRPERLEAYRRASSPGALVR